jgi:hypothetical protein
MLVTKLYKFSPDYIRMLLERQMFLIRNDSKLVLYTWDALFQKTKDERKLEQDGYTKNLERNF